MPREADKYTYRVMWSDEDNEYIGLCAEFPGLSWLATSPEEALKGIRSTVRKCVKDLTQTGEPVPQAITTKKYSGSLTYEEIYFSGEPIHSVWAYNPVNLWAIIYS
jgi:predicted RNase H-like HicB family nuclease